jgi:hypothetical protein
VADEFGRGKLVIDGQDWSGLACGTGVTVNVGSPTRITIDLAPASFSLSAQGQPEINLQPVSDPIAWEVCEQLIAYLRQQYGGEARLLDLIGSSSRPFI